MEIPREIHDLIDKYESKSLTLPALPIGYIQVVCGSEEWTVSRVLFCYHSHNPGRYNIAFMTI